MKKLVSIEGMTCSHCVARVEKALAGVPGVAKVKVDLKKNLAELKSEDADDVAIRAAVTDAGYAVTIIQTL